MPNTPYELVRTLSPVQTVTLPRGDLPDLRVRVVLVDDDQLILNELRRYLEQGGYEVICLRSDDDAIAYFRHYQADVVILNVEMASIHGFETLKQILVLMPEVMAIISTAQSSEALLVEALRYGAYDYIQKPAQDHDLSIIFGRVVATLLLKRQNILLQRQLEEKRTRLEMELARAAQVQADLLPDIVPHLEGYNLAARCVPAQDVGGDFYDWQMPREGLLNMVFGDVMGKGMPAALLMTTARAVFRSTIRGVAPEINISYAAAVLEPDLERANSFLTLFHAQLDVQTGVVRYVDCGHGCAFIVRANGELIEELVPRGVPLGLPRQDPFVDGHVVLQRGDSLIIYSDGLLDACPELLEQGNQAVADLIQGCSTADAIVQCLIEVVGVNRSLPDDLTIMALVRDV